MRSRRRKITQDESRSLGSQILGLTMFIMLLAFFIILNSISTFNQEKVQPLRESLQMAFTSTLTTSVDLDPSIVSTADKENSEGKVTARLERLFSANIAGVEAKTDDGTGTILLRMKYDDFKKAVSAAEAGVSSKSDFMRTLVSLVRTDMSGFTYRMDAFVQVSGNPAHLQNRDPRKINAIMGELAGLATHLGRTGLPDKLMSFGIEEGDEGMVEVLFRPHVPYNPQPYSEGGE